MDIPGCCADVLVGLDEDALEYIASVCGEEGEVTVEEDDLQEVVVPMLVGAELVDDEDAAAVLVSKLFSRLMMGGRDEGDAAEGAAERAEAARQERQRAMEPKLLSRAVDLKKEARAFDMAAAKTAVTADKTLINQEIDTTAADDADGEGGDPKAAQNAAARCERLTKEVMQENAALEHEMAVARAAAARARTKGTGGHALGAIETGTFSLPNPGGGPDLIESAAAVLVPGRRYGLIGRNGKGKSTLLKSLAARRVGGLPETLSLHYVSQTVADMGSLEVATPREVVLAADVERTMLVEYVHGAERSRAAAAAAAAPAAAAAAAAAARPGSCGECLSHFALISGMHCALRGCRAITTLEALCSLSDAQSTQLQAAHERMGEIGGDAAPGAVEKLLRNLGFSDELASRPVKQLSGGWRVRVGLACALFAAPDLLLLDEPTNHLSIEAVLWLSRELSEYVSSARSTDAPLS
jgi:ATP-binding cassette subfamily F protein 3